MPPTNRSARPGVSFVEAIKLGFKRYVDFDGRSSLSEYWWWQLAIAGGFLLLSLLLQATQDPYGDAPVVVDLLIYAGFFGTLLPNLAVGIRRLHDVGHSGLYLLWGLVPVVGSFIIFLAVVRQPSPDGDRYGSAGGGGARKVTEISLVDLNASPRAILAAVHEGVTAERTVPILSDGLWQEIYGPSRVIWSWGNRAEPSKFALEVSAVVGGATGKTRCRQSIRGTPVTYQGFEAVKRAQGQIAAVLAALEPDAQPSASGSTDE